MKRILECVPNFSDGQNPAVYQAIADAAARVEGVMLLDVDPGFSTNRTVVTFAGEPEAVIEAAFQAIKRAAQLIDMRQHKGTHPRMGATDVCPLIPIEGITDEEAVALAHRLAARVGEELQIPVYLYEKAASRPARSNLADIRAGEYEGFVEKIHHPDWAPDYGPRQFNAQAGQTVIGVRDFLVAYNINLNTRSVRRANSVAFDIREKGRVKTADGTPNGQPLLDAEGQPVREPGLCKAVKAIGWYVPEYGFAQVSANLTDIQVSPVHTVFDAACLSASRRGLRVTGSELVGLIPLKALLDAGRHYLRQQGLSEGVSDEELVEPAVQSLGLGQLGPFDPQKKVIEYRLAQAQAQRLQQMSLRQFASEVASESPAPGGGSVAAYCGALGASLGAMVANLSAGKKGWEHRVEEFSRWAVEGQQLKSRLLALVDEDSQAFDRVMDAYRLPRGTDAEKKQRTQAIEAALKGAALAPLGVMEAAAACFPLLEAMAAGGNPSSVTDAGVGAWCVRAAMESAALNVRINLGSIKDQAFTQSTESRVKELLALSLEKTDHIQRVVAAIMTKS